MAKRKKNKKYWLPRIMNACKEAGTYRPYFDDVIDTLADILEKREDALDQYKEAGSMPLVPYTNNDGATNMVKNPALSLIDLLNKDALSYWRDLGLTPAGLKKINDDLMKAKTENALAAALKELDG